MFSSSQTSQRILSIGKAWRETGLVAELEAFALLADQKALQECLRASDARLVQLNAVAQCSSLSMLIALSACGWLGALSQWLFAAAFAVLFLIALVAREACAELARELRETRDALAPQVAPEWHCEWQWASDALRKQRDSLEQVMSPTLQSLLQRKLATEIRASF